MTERDWNTISGIGVLVASGVLALQGLGIDVPIQWAAGVPLGAGILIAAVRIYVAVRGADRTTADEALERAEEIVAEAAKRAGRKGP